MEVRATRINTERTPNKTKPLRKEYLAITTERALCRNVPREEHPLDATWIAVVDEGLTWDDAMVALDTPERHGEEALRPLRAPESSLEFEPTGPCLGVFASRSDDVPPDPPRLGNLWRCRTRQNLTGASLPQIRRGLARAWRLMLAQRTVEAHEAIDRIELQLDDVSASIATPLRAATQLLRAADLALQDDSLAALAIASSHLSENPAAQDGYAASTLCRLGFWQLGQFGAFHALPRHQPRVRWSRPHAISAIVDLSIEAAVALDHLNVTTAKRLASDALTLADRVKVAAGLAALPASLTAQVLYEEGSLYDADNMLRDRLPAINAEGSIECALRAYLVLSRIARQRMHYDLAAILLHEAEALGQRRQWPRLVAASVAERVSLLLEVGRTKEARLSVDHLDRNAEIHRAGSGRSGVETTQYRTLSRWRVSWTEAPSRKAVAALRQLYHRAVERHDLYAGCRLAVELADMLASIDESEEADSLFFHTIKLGAAAGLYQVFLEKHGGSGTLLRRAYARADATGSTERHVLPFVGSLLSRWEARHAEGAQMQQTSIVRETLTARERDILRRIGQGLPNKQIARAFEISPETVKSHIKNIFLKLAVGTRAEAVSRSKSLGLL
jgi:ATP/maltotriose-dependent transcriptional regulator MalT